MSKSVTYNCSVIYTDNNGVSVVIPSYNRAEFLPETIPSYIQEGVAELILVDDCSTDDTPTVVTDLMKKYPQIRYFRNEMNMRQTGAKNRALQYVTQPYVYFGDDDSYLLPGTIPYLYKKMQEVHADVIAALPIYADTNEDMYDLSELVKRKAILVKDWKQYVDVAHMERANFFFRMNAPVRVPFTNACALMKSTCIKHASFDTRFGGNCYREETDYFLQLSEKGYNIYFAANEQAAQINLPFARIGRKRTLKSMWRHGKYDIINTLKLIDKHYKYFKKECRYPHSKLYMKFAYVWNASLQYVGIFPNRIRGILRQKFIN